VYKTSILRIQIVLDKVPHSHFLLPLDNAKASEPFSLHAVICLPRVEQPAGLCYPNMANKKNKAQAKRSAKRAINKSQNHLEKEEFEDDHGITTLETNTEPSMQDYSEAAQFQSGIEGSGPRKLTPILPFNPDSENQGEAAWRNGGKPAMFYQFPRNFDPMTFDDPNSKFNRLHGIALQTKTYITFRKDQDVAIYGTREDTEKAAILIDAWVEEYDLPKLNASAQWAKVHSPTPESQARLHKAIEKEMKRNAWRQPPNVNSKYRFQVCENKSCLLPRDN